MKTSVAVDKMTEKTNNDIPTFIMSSSEISEKRRPYKKYAIIAGCVVLTIAIILTAILIGVYFFSETQKEIIKFAYMRDDNSKEEVTSNPNENTVQYHTNSDDYELWAYNDFNRDIQVVKYRYNEGTNCYVTALNRTMAQDPSEIKVPTEVNPKAPKIKYHVTYRVGKDPISDVSFLCKSARDACSGISTYWVYPSCEDSTDLKRQKRGKLVCGWAGFIWGCYIEW